MSVTPKSVVLIPNTAEEFREQSYWAKFFEAVRDSFEWFATFGELWPQLKHYLKLNDSIVEIGCGNSKLGAELYDHGYCDITCIDVETKAIEQQVDANADQRPRLKFLCTSAEKLDFEDGKVSIVLDKGTLDALLPVGSSDSEDVLKIFDEVDRILAIGGRYIVVSLAQQQLFDVFAEHFRKKKYYIIRIERITLAPVRCGLSVFMFVLFKLRTELDTDMFEYVRGCGAKPLRISTLKELQSLVSSDRDLARLKNHCSQLLKQEISLTIRVNTSDYHIKIADDPKLVDIKEVLTFGVYILECNQCNSWLRSTVEGRKIIREKCGKSRIAIVILPENRSLDIFDSVKTELDYIALCCAPPNLTGQIDYMTCDSTETVEVATGESDISGKWCVEDTMAEGSTRRQLVFLSSSFIIQSEAVMKFAEVSSTTFVPDLDSLASYHHRGMLMSFAFMREQVLRFPEKAKMRLLVLGLGGGLFPAYLHRKFMKARIDIVELDPEVVDIARNYFAFPSCANLNVIIEDAENFIMASERYNSYDVLFVDLAAAKPEGTICPPDQFTTRVSLSAMYSLLKSTGILTFNVVIYDKEIYSSMLAHLEDIFSTIFFVPCEPETNKVLVCCKLKGDIDKVKALCDSFKNAGDWRNLLTLNI